MEAEGEESVVDNRETMVEGEETEVDDDVTMCDTDATLDDEHQYPDTGSSRLADNGGASAATFRSSIEVT